jgi:cell wall-associated NlpC family hydrolase
MSPRLHGLLPLLALVALFAVATLGMPAAATALDRPDPRPPSMEASEPTLGERAAAYAVKVVGVPYRWAGTSPESGFDCSGLVYWAYGQVGVSVPHSSYALYSTGKRVSRSQLKPGDVLFFDGLGHVGMYLGSGRMVHAPETGRNVEVVKLARSHYGSRIVGARRIAAA